MGFLRLVGDHESEILLANLHEMARSGIVAADLLKQSLRAIRQALEAGPAGADAATLRRLAHGAIYADADGYQVKGVETPRRDLKISAVMGFDKVLPILRVISQRRRDDSALQTWVQAVRSATAPAATIREAADLLNQLAERNPDLTLSNYRTLFWAAPTYDIDETLQAEVRAAGGVWDGDELAGHLRNRLGLVHVKPFMGGRAQHLFLFQSHKTLDELTDIDIDCARPTALDGIDNPRFSQALHVPPRINGCGLTVDLTGGRFRPGLPEIALTPLSIGHFSCGYIGELKDDTDGTHEDFLRAIAPGATFDQLAQDLIAMAA